MDDRTILKDSILRRAMCSGLVHPAPPDLSAARRASLRWPWLPVDDLGAEGTGCAEGVLLMRLLRLGLLLILVMSAAVSCTGEDERQTVLLAVTTSVDNSGLLDALAGAFGASSPYHLEWVAVGTGQALELGQNGDVDAVFVHGGDLEEAFMSGGWGVERSRVMWNSFVIVGPAYDPAGVAGAEGAVSALGRVAGAESIFVSRGDDSGTHLVERALWVHALGDVPPGSWYLEVGQGMTSTLRIASERGGYTLTDTATLAVMEKELSLAVLSEGDPLLHNQYSVIAVNPERHPRINHSGALAFIEWITGEKGQEVIRGFGLNGSEQPLFEPNAMD